MRGSVVDIRSDAHLPPSYSLLHAKEGKIAIEVLVQLDAHSVRGIALTPTEGLDHGGAGAMRVCGSDILRHCGSRSRQLPQVLYAADVLHAAIQHHRRTFTDAGPGHPFVRQYDERGDDCRHPIDYYALHLPHRHDAARSAHGYGAGLHFQHPGDSVHRGRYAGPAACPKNPVQAGAS